jgi:hypothetical protein
MGSIKEMAIKIKIWGIRQLRRYGLGLCVFFAVLGAFGLGRLSVVYEPKEPILSPSEALRGELPTERIAKGEGGYVASNTGETYYFPWCSGGERIPEEKRIYFATIADAERSGYRPAGTCKGLE